MQFRHFRCYLQSYSAKYLPTFILLGIFAFLITSCSGDPQVLPTLVEFPTEVSASNVQSTDAAAGLVTEETNGFVTQEVALATDEVAETPEVFSTPEFIRYQTEDGKLFVVVTSVNTEETMPNLPDAPVGEKFLVLSTTLANFTGESIQVEASSLTLIDQQFNRYSPVQPDDFLRTPLFEVELDGSRTVLGSIRFAIPTDAIPYLLEWCPYNDCEVETLQTFLP